MTRALLQETRNPVGRIPRTGGDISRSLVGTRSTNFIAQVDEPLRAVDLAVEANCTGPSDNSVTYRFGASDIAEFGLSGHVECNEPPSIGTFSSALPRSG